MNIAHFSGNCFWAIKKRKKKNLRPLFLFVQTKEKTRSLENSIMSLVHLQQNQCFVCVLLFSPVIFGPFVFWRDQLDGGRAEADATV